MNFVRVGYISGTFGLDGAVRVKPITENPDIFYNMEFLLLSKIDSLVPVKSLKIDDIREHKNYFVVELSSINEIKEAENLKGFSVVIPEYMLPEENEDEIYWYKINGACVNNLQNDKIGILIIFVNQNGIVCHYSPQRVAFCRKSIAPQISIEYNLISFTYD